MIASISVRIACCAAALVAAGCTGFPGDAQVGNQPPSDAQLQQWAQCMNQHGVHVTVSSNGSTHSTSARAPVGNGQPGSGQQAMLAAQAACKQFQPSSGGSNQQPSAQQLDQATKYVQCVNQHGGNAKVDPRNGGIEEQPGPAGPAVQDQADQACQSLDPGRGH